MDNDPLASRIRWVGVGYVCRNGIPFSFILIFVEVLVLLCNEDEITLYITSDEPF